MLEFDKNKRCTIYDVNSCINWSQTKIPIVPNPIDLHKYFTFILDYIINYFQQGMLDLDKQFIVRTAIEQ